MRVFILSSPNLERQLIGPDVEIFLPLQCPARAWQGKIVTVNNSADEYQLHQESHVSTNARPGSSAEGNVDREHLLQLALAGCQPPFGTEGFGVCEDAWVAVRRVRRDADICVWGDDLASNNVAAIRRGGAEEVCSNRR